MVALRTFQETLLDLGRRKMREMLPRVVDDKVLFSHLIDETILFEKDLKGEIKHF